MQSTVGKFIGLLVSLATCGQLVLPEPAAAQDRYESQRPDIVLVMADDLGWSDIGCYGGEIPTPHLDSLAANGIRFTQFYNNAVCGPTRASLLTGLYCQQVGHAGNQWNQPKDFSRCVTLAEVLQTSGYHTAMVGKWQGRDPAIERGFDRFFGPRCQAKISYFHEVQGNPFFKNGKRWRLPEDGSFYMTDAFGDHAVEFAQEATGKRGPFFLYLAYIAPHWPLHAPEKQIAPHRERYRTKGWDEWRQTRFENQRSVGLVPPQWQLAPKAAPFPDWDDAPEHEWQAERMAVYAAQVAAIDRGVGRVVDVLKERGAFRQHAVPVSLRQRRRAQRGCPADDSGLWICAGPGQRQVAARWWCHPSRLRSGQSARPRGHICCLRHRLGDHRQHAVPQQQVECLGGRHSHAIDRPLAGWHRRLVAGRTQRLGRPRHRFHADLLRTRRSRVSDRT